jgi:hypothetical protein
MQLTQFFIKKLVINHLVLQEFESAVCLQYLLNVCEILVILDKTSSMTTKK